MFEADYKQATVIYLYGTCLDDEEIKRLVRRFEGLAPGTKVITVSYPLSEYADTYMTHKEFPARFPWGRAQVYLNYKVA